MINNEDDYYGQPAEEENYFISMTDMMVGLVFIFVILMMYFALQFRHMTAELQISTGKLRDNALELAKTTEQLTNSEEARSDLLEKLVKYLRDHNVKVEVDAGNGVLHLPDEILFDSGRADLKPEGVAALGRLAEALAKYLPCYADGTRPELCGPNLHKVESIFIEGHTDIDKVTPRPGISDNWDLSVVRATNTYRLLTTIRPELAELCVIIEADRCSPVLSVSGYADKRPIAVGDSDAAKRQNRRIDLRILMLVPRSDDVAKIQKRLEEMR